MRPRQILQIGSAFLLAGVASLGTLAGGCGGARVSTLKEAASADMSCPKSRVIVLTKSGKVREVEACGQRATYQWDEDDWRMIARGVPAYPAAGPQPVVMHAPPSPPGYIVRPQPAPLVTATSQPTGTPSQPPPSMLPPSQPPPVAPAKPAPGARSL